MGKTETASDPHDFLALDEGDFLIPGRVFRVQHNEGQNMAGIQSFLERYVIERAGSFRVGHEGEDTWKAILDGRRAFEQIQRTAHDYELSKSVTLPAGNAGQALPQEFAGLPPDAAKQFAGLPPLEQHRIMDMERQNPGTIQRIFGCVTSRLPPMKKRATY
jgi:hypothetical protein